jgi:steroid delta-isomerase-like uncharacterized protein
MSGTNVTLLKRWFEEVWNQRRAATISELFATNGVAHGSSDTGGDIHGPKEFLAFYERITGSFSDIHFAVEDAMESGDKVVLRWSATMKHTGDKLGIKASGKQIRIGGVTIARFENGQVVEGWDNWDKLGMLQQIGALQLAASGGD